MLSTYPAAGQVDIDKVDMAINRGKKGTRMAWEEVIGNLNFHGRVLQLPFHVIFCLVEVNLLRGVKMGVYLGKITFYRKRFVSSVFICSRSYCVPVCHSSSTPVISACNSSSSEWSALGNVSYLLFLRLSSTFFMGSVSCTDRDLFGGGGRGRRFAGTARGSDP